MPGEYAEPTLHEPVLLSVEDEPATRAAKATVMVLQTLGLTPKLHTPDVVPPTIAAYAEIQAQTEPALTLTLYGDLHACTEISMTTLGLPADDDERCAEVLAEIGNIVAGKWLSTLAPGGAISFGMPNSGAASRDEVVLAGLRGVSLGAGHLLVGVTT